MIRTHDAGALRVEHVGQTVTLAGWVARRRDHGGVAFLDLREASGVVQVVVRDEAVAHSLRSEYCLKVTGEVVARKAGNENPNLADRRHRGRRHRRRGAQRRGAAAVPHRRRHVARAARSARRPASSTATSTCAAAAPTARCACAARSTRRPATSSTRHDFVEVETPTLTRSTPEGARDFLVPARLQPGSWYALPQSPQLFKQLLMVAGMERYYQIARCYRDEDFRADRQPEFTQLDIEMSFVDQDDVIASDRGVLAALWRLIGHDDPAPAAADDVRRGDGAASAPTSPTCAWASSSSSAPSYFKDTPFRVFQAPYVGAVVMPGGAGQPRKQLDAWQEWAKQRGAKGLAYVLVQEDGELDGPGRRRTSPTRRRPAWPPTSAPSPATASSSPPARPSPAAPCSAPRASRSAAAAG